MTTFSEAAAKDPFVFLAKTAAPAPVRWTEATGVQQVAGLKVRQWLAWPAVPTPWSRKCETQPWRAWALWTGLYGLGVAEGNRGLVEVEPVGSREGVLAIVGGVRLVTGKPENEATDVRVAIGGVGDGWLITPGLRLEDVFPVGGGAGALLQLELARALGWLAADEPLGLVALCGPLSTQVYGGPTQYRRDAGYLDGGYGLTKSGWWRLAYEAGQGVGRQEGHRAVLLKKMCDYQSNRDPRGDRRMHVRHTQALVLKLRRQEDLVPLGVEYSALGQHFRRELTIRADALMASPDGGKLVWVEWLRKKERDYSVAWRERFAAKRKAMVDVANAIGRPVEFYVDYPLGLKRRGVERWAQVPTGEAALSELPADLWTVGRAAAEAYTDQYQPSDEEAEEGAELDFLRDVDWESESS